MTDAITIVLPEADRERVLAALKAMGVEWCAIVAREYATRDRRPSDRSPPSASVFADWSGK